MGIRDRNLANILSYVIIGVILIIIIQIINKIAKGGSRGSTLVLKDFIFNDAEYEYLKIFGRPAGFISWIKSLLGKDSVTSFICNKQEIKLENSGIKYNVPLRHVTCVASGKDKPFILLILGIIFIILGLFGAKMHALILCIGLVLGIILIILSTRSKNIFFNIFTVENKPIISIRVKGQSMDFDKFISATDALNTTVLEIVTPIKVIK
jgi:hypothetical protein